MSALEIVLTVAVVWLAGALVLLLIEEKLRRDEYVALTLWPLVVPVGLVWRRYRRWAYTCRDCKRWYGDKPHYELHLRVRHNCTVPPAPGVDPDDYTVPSKTRRTLRSSR